MKSNGAIYKTIDEEEIEINRIKKSQLRKIDKKLNALNYQTISLDEVGNMTYFIEVIYSDSSHKLTWTDQTDHPELKELYNDLTGTLLKPEK